MAKQRGWTGLEALTIDRCQGRDKDVILVSMVRSTHSDHMLSHIAARPLTQTWL